MKATALFISIMALCLIAIPMIATGFDTGTPAPQADVPVHDPLRTQSAPVQGEAEPDSYPPEETEADAQGGPDEARVLEESDTYGEAILAADTSIVSISFKILDQSTGVVNEVSARDFVRGAVAAEMPALFHSEALKAQAVAAHTFALHNMLVQRDNPDPALKGADFAADPSNMKVYITEKTAREFYGDNADIYWKKVCDAADSVLGYALEYDGEPIVAAYHAISSGVTEDAANVWSGSAPYLMPVESGGDLLAPGYETTVKLTPAEVKAKLTAAYPDISLDGEPSGWFGEPLRSGSGYVLEIAAGSETLAGKDVRQALDLRSHDFTIDYGDGGFTFTVYGYGHGLGLSQYGADFLARQGLTFDEILGTYYTGAELISVTVEE